MYVATEAWRAPEEFLNLYRLLRRPRAHWIRYVTGSEKKWGLCQANTKIFQTVANCEALFAEPNPYTVVNYGLYEMSWESLNGSALAHVQFQPIAFWPFGNVLKVRVDLINCMNSRRWLVQAQLTIISINMSFTAPQAARDISSVQIKEDWA